MNSFPNTVRVSPKIVLAALLLSILPNHLSTVFAQGTMKCVGGLNYPLDRIRARFWLKCALGHDGLITSGWTYQTFQDSRGFTDTRVTHAAAHSDSGSLAVLANLARHDPNRARGVYVDLRIHSRTAKAPLNLLGATISFWICLPMGAAGLPSAPNGIQVFLKSGDKFFNWYSPFMNITLAEGGMDTDYRGHVPTLRVCRPSV